MKEFEQAISAWRTAALRLAEAEVEYARLHGSALAKSEGKTEALRKADADAATEPSRQRRDLARIEETSARWRVYYLLRVAGDRNILTEVA